MKKLLLSFVCVLAFAALSAQVSDNFSDYTVDGKLAQQAQAMGRDYWTTWSEAPGSSEDGVIAEIAGNKCLYLIAPNNDQILKLGNKTSGEWVLTFKFYIPAGKDGYFNIKSVFPSTVSETWALQVYLGTDEGGPSTPGFGAAYGGSTAPVPFPFAHDTWVPVKIYINLDTDVAEFYVNEIKYLTYTYSTGSFGQSNHKYIDAMNIFPPNTASTSSFYIDDIVFQDASLPPPPPPIMNVTPLVAEAEADEGDTEPFTTEITVTNTGESEGTYTSKVVYGGDVEDWITLTGDANGTVAPEGTKNFNIVMNPTDLVFDTYQANILVETNDTEHPSFIIACTLVVNEIDTTGVDSYTLIQTKLFPNPTSGEVTIDCDKVINQIDILNYMGQVVYSSEVNTTTIKTDISQLNAGTYFVRIKTEVGTQTSKLIVK